MVIAFITSSLGYGGAAKMLAFVANNLSDNNIVHVIAYSCASPVPSFKDSVQLHLLNVKGHSNILKGLYRCINTISPDILVSFLTFPNMYSVILGKLMGIPVVVSERGNPYVLKGLKNRIVYSIINLANGAVFQTEGAKSFFCKRLQKRSVIIPNPVFRRNQYVEYNPDCNNHQIVFVGRLENVQKRLDLLFDALGLVINHYPDAIINIYGDGEDEDALKELASKYSYANSIVFKGKTADPESAMAKSEVFVISSDYEGIPNSLIEAMSIGMPVVATDCDPGGARLLVQNEINGFLVPKGDIKALAEKIICLFSNKRYRVQFSHRAKEITYIYSENNIKEKWISFLNGFSHKSS